MNSDEIWQVSEWPGIIKITPNARYLEDEDQSYTQHEVKVYGRISYCLFMQIMVLFEPWIVLNMMNWGIIFILHIFPP